MTQCVAIDGAGALVASSESPCTTFVLMTPIEYTFAASNPFFLDTADGALVSGAIAAVWGLAWGIRQIRAAMDGPGDDSS